VSGLATEGGWIDCHREPSGKRGFYGAVIENQQFERGNPSTEKLYIFGNKARGRRVSYLAA
jgi:hypothetical protein